VAARSSGSLVRESAGVPEASLRLIWPADRRETWDELVTKMNNALQLPCWTNAFTMPIKTRVDMLTRAFGRRSASRSSGPTSPRSKTGIELESVMRGVRATRSVLYERFLEGAYIDVIPRRDARGRHGLQIDDLNEVVSSAIGGDPITTTIEGRNRFTVNIRYKWSAASSRARSHARADPGHLHVLAVPPSCAARSARASARGDRRLALG
jgi:copper/silver efflux system protein